jgi:hypothetical protein
MSGRRAILIGINQYGEANDQFPSLTASVNDARAMADALRQAGAFDAGEITLLEDPARTEVLEAMLEIYELPRPLDRLLLFFSGHGLVLNLGRGAARLSNVLVCAGCRRTRNSGDRLIDLDELAGWLSRCGAREQFWIVDACRAPPPGGESVVVPEIGWSAPQGLAQQADSMAQEVLFAVAPLNVARARPGEHGVMTAALLRGLTGEGVAAVYDEDGDDFSDPASVPCLVTLQSLADHAIEAIRPTLPANRWTESLLPRVASLSEARPGPLLRLGRRPKRGLTVRVQPPGAAEAIRVSLSQGGNEIAAWPPLGFGQPSQPLTGRPYRIAASVRDSYYLHHPLPRFVDPRLSAELVLSLGQEQQQQQQQQQHQEERQRTQQQQQQQQQRGYDWRDAQPEELDALPLAREAVQAPPAGMTAAITVRALEAGAMVHLRSLEGRPPRTGPAGEPLAVEPGAWLVELRLGRWVAGALEVELVAGRHLMLTARAEVTPAAAVLLPVEGRERPERVERIAGTGPMQGAVLATLLPQLALKPFDIAGTVLPELTQFRWPAAVPAEASSAPLGLAVAVEGTRQALRPLEPEHVLKGLEASAAGEALVPWAALQGRIALLAAAGPSGPEATLRVGARFWPALDIAVPRLPGFATAVALTLLPGGGWDVMVSCSKLPDGSGPDAAGVAPARVARALALAVRLGAAGLRALSQQELRQLASGTWRNPVLLAIAFYALRGGHGTGHGLGDPQLLYMIARTLVGHFRALPDSLVIGTFGEPLVDASQVLALPPTHQPVLADSVRALARLAQAAGQADHWAVARAQRLAPGAMFNAIPHPSLLPSRS